MSAMFKARLTLTPRELGSMVLDDFCPRCFWLGHGLNAPFQDPVPGVSSRIEALARQQVDYSYMTLHAYPDYLGLDPGRDFPVSLGLLDWRRFQTTVKLQASSFKPRARRQIPDSGVGTTDGHGRTPTGELGSGIGVGRCASVVDSGQGLEIDVVLRGRPDRVFSTNPAHTGGKVTFVDFKTSVFTEGQEKLLPRYQVQLGCCAYIAEALGWGRVKRMALVYWQPKPDMRGTLMRYRSQAQTGWATVPFLLDFDPLVKEVEIDFRKVIPRLAAEAAKLLVGPRPEKSPICKNCSKLDDLVRRTAFTFLRHPEVVS